MGFQYNPLTGMLDLSGSTPVGMVTSSSGSSTDNAIARFDGTSGNVIQTSGASIDDSGNITGTNLSGTNTGNVTLTAVGSSPSASGASLSGQALTLQPADGSFPGLVTTGNQTFAGVKTFSTSVITDVIQGTVTGPCILPSNFLLKDNNGNPTVSWNTYLLKDGNSNITVDWGNQLLKNTSGTTIVDWSGTGPTLGGTTTVGNLIDSGLTASTVPYANASKQLTSSSVTPTELDYLSGVTSAVQTQLNGKQATGNYITSLTGDVTASGPGSVASTVAKIAGTTVSGTTGSGNVVFSSAPTLSNPVVGTQATSDNSTKAASTAYVTTAIANAIAGVNPAVAVNAATTAASDTSGLTYSNGVAGVGATLTGSNNTALVIDGYTFTALGQRLLVKDDTQSPSGAYNGVYYVTQIQTAILPPILTRALDYNSASDINNTGAIPVISGTTNADTSWLLTSSVTTVGTDPLTYRIFTTRVSSGDISETSFTAADNQSSAANVTGLAFANGTVRSADILLSVVRNTTYAVYKINVVQGASSWYINSGYTGDATGLTFSITSAGQVQYTSTSTGSTATVKFRAITTSV